MFTPAFTEFEITMFPFFHLNLVMKLHIAHADQYASTLVSYALYLNFTIQFIQITSLLN